MIGAASVSPWASAVWSGAGAEPEPEPETESEPEPEPAGEPDAGDTDKVSDLMTTTPHIKPDEIGRRRATSAPPPGPRIRPGTTDPPWAEAGDAPWLSRARMTLQTRIKGRGGWLTALLIAALAIAALALLMFGPLNRYVPTALDISVEPVPEGAVEPPPTVRDTPRESVMLGQDGYALRVLRPKEIVAGVTYEISIDVWDPEGEPIDAEAIAIELSGPGTARTRSDARPGVLRGRFNLKARFAEAGDHEMRIFAAGDNPVVLHLTAVGG
jgi:hypothetical protein